MIKKLILIVAALAVSACASYHPRGFLYTETTMGIESGDAKNTKTGRACVNSYFGLVAVGDASLEKAKADGDIHEIASINYEVNNVLGMVANYCLVVRGS